MALGIKVTTSVRRNNQAMAALSNTRDRQLLIGIPKANNGGRVDPSDPGNAMLLFWHEFGTVTEPARPSLIPGVRSILPQARRKLRAAVQREVRGQTGAVQQELVALGLLGQVAVQARIRSGIPPPITEMTKRWRLEKRRAYQNASPAAKQRMMASWLAGTFTPLIDTGRMLQAITFVVIRGPP
jgi:hypothetical protein